MPESVPSTFSDTHERDHRNDDRSLTEQPPRVLVVDDDLVTCRLLEKTVSGFGMRVKTTINPLDVPDLVNNTFFNVVLLDIQMPEKSGLDVLPEILEATPDTKVIIITGYADKDSAIAALRSGAFDFLEKPLDKDLVSHTIDRALKTQKIQLAYKREKIKLKKVNRQLDETNSALSTLARNIERRRQDTETAIEKAIRTSITPMVDQIRQSKGLSQELQSKLQLLSDMLANLRATLNVQQTLGVPLTPTESRIAALISEGLTTNQIAEHMHVSPDTVKSHRRNIRRKLNLNNTNHNLRAHLQAMCVRYQETDTL